MPIKKTTKTDSKASKTSEKKVVAKSENKKDSTKKVVVKRRKSDLKPTKASAVAIVSQANRAKKQALIEKVSNSVVIPNKKVDTSADTKIPLWVWMFFGCSLLLFCISFYNAIIYPQLHEEQIDESIEFLAGGVENDDYIENGNVDIYGGQSSDGNVATVEEPVVKVPETATETIEEFFNRLSNRQFDEAFDLMLPALRNASEIRDHFTSFRMNPFLDGIENGKLVPMNFKYVNSTAHGKDVYNFDLSYILKSDKSEYNETWEFTVNTQGNEPKISSIRCMTSKCSYHPIFWPENFGLMR